MKRMLAGAIVAAFGLAAAAQDKVEFRYKFDKGAKFPVNVKYSLNVKFDEVPEAFQGVLSEEPVNIQVEGRLNVEVKEVADGKATLEGAWRTIKVKGMMLLSEIDFEFDSEKATESKPKKAEDPAFGGFGDVEDQLRQFASKPMRLTVDPRGRVSVQEAGRGALSGVGSQLFSLNGLMGIFPESGLAKGESWKSEEELSLPGGLAGALSIRVEGQNTYAGNEKLGDREVAVLASKFSVANKEGKGDPAQAFQFKMKTSGEGEGKAHFDAKAGRPVKTNNSLKVRIEATIQNPGGGDDINLKATLKTQNSYEVGN